MVARIVGYGARSLGMMPCEPTTVTQLTGHYERGCGRDALASAASSPALSNQATCALKPACGAGSRCIGRRSAFRGRP